MPYAIEMYFDPDAENRVRALWAEIAAGRDNPALPTGDRPHVSLGVFDSNDLDVPTLRRSLAVLAEDLDPFPLTLSHVGVFPTVEGILFLGVTVTEGLHRAHAAFKAAFAPFVPWLRPYYRPGSWVPHCTLAIGLSAEACAAVLPRLWQAPIPVRAQVREIGLCGVSPDHCEPLAVVALE